MSHRRTKFDQLDRLRVLEERRYRTKPDYFVRRPREKRIDAVDTHLRRHVIDEDFVDDEE